MRSWTDAVIDTMAPGLEGPPRMLLTFLLEASQHGHTAIPLDELDRLVEGVNDDREIEPALDPEEIRAGIAGMDWGALKGFLCQEWECLVWHADRRKEERVAGLLAARIGVDVPLAPGSDLDVGLEDEQAHAFRLLRTSPFLLLVGGPGTGKSYLIAKYLEHLSSEERQRTAVAAPTGRAASRLNEVIQAFGCAATTVHRLLQIYPQYGVRSAYAAEENPLPFDTVIVDETSMLDMDLFLQLLEALSPATRLILVGDELQLPSVQSGAVLRDLVSFVQSRPRLAARHLAKLTVNRRLQGADEDRQALQRLFQRVRESRDPSIPTSSGVDHVRTFTYQTLLDEAAGIWGPKIQRFPKTTDELEEWLRSDIVLLPLRRQSWGVTAFQKALKQRLRFPSDKKEGMPLLVRSNQPAFGLSNGDRGQLRLRQNTWVVAFPGPDERLRHIPLSQIQSYEDGFALTVHKSQGSEFDRVVLALTEGSERLMSKELFYTAITRTRRKLVLYASEARLRQCLEHQTLRHTLLPQRLAERVAPKEIARE